MEKGSAFVVVLAFSGFFDSALRASLRMTAIKPNESQALNQNEAQNDGIKPNESQALNQNEAQNDGIKPNESQALNQNEAQNDGFWLLHS